MFLKYKGLNLHVYEIWKVLSSVILMKKELELYVSQNIKDLIYMFLKYKGLELYDFNDKRTWAICLWELKDLKI